MNIALLKSKITCGIMYSSIVLMLMSFIYNNINMGKVLDQISYIILLPMLFIFLIKNCNKIFMDDLILLAAFIIPIELILLVEFSLTDNMDLIKKAAFWGCKILVYYFLGRTVGFVKYTSILRIGSLISLLFVIMALIFGQYRTEFITNVNGLFLYFMNIGVLIAPGEDIGISLPTTGDLNTPRIGGLFGHPNSWGIVSAFGFCGLFYKKTTIKQYVFWIVILLLVFIMTQSRGMLLFVLMFVFIYAYTRKSRQRKYHIIKAVIPIIVIFAFYGLLFMRDTYTDANSVSAGRLELLQTAWNDYMSMDIMYQLFGIGMGERSEYLFSHHGVAMALDNSYVPLFLEIGAVGAIVWIVALGLGLYLFIKKINCGDSSRWLPICGAVFVHSMVESTLLPGVPYGIPFYVFLFSSVNYLKQKNVK